MCSRLFSTRDRIDQADRMQSPSTSTIFEAERTASTKWAMKARIVFLLVMLIWVAATRYSIQLYAMLGAVMILIAVSYLHFRLADRYREMPWLPYAFYGFDVAFLICAIWGAMRFGFPDLPAGMLYYFNYFPFFFLVMVSTGLSLSPKVVLWTGGCIVLGWMGLYHVIDHPGSLDWGDIPPGLKGPEYLSFLLSPDWTAGGSRLQESIVIMGTSAVLALIVYRGRLLVQRQIEADKDRQAVRAAFGQYVPDAIADATVAAGGVLPPQERRASVLFCDLAGFTGLTHRLGPDQTVKVLNAYFDMVAREVGAAGGVITQFQGDAALAVFNAPSDLADYEAAAIRCGRTILSRCETQSFEGEQLMARIGVATGQLMAGTVGGEGRRGYTVHGDVVNLAARLESLNKELGSHMLIDGETAEALSEEVSAVAHRDTPVRGLVDPITVFAIPPIA